MKTILIILSFLFFTGTGVIHQDRILKLRKNGEIIGLPKQFQPATFDQRKKILRIKEKQVSFPPCVREYFEELENPNVELFASWYHSKVILPYYIGFYISPKGLNYGYEILVDLETLELIYLKKTLSNVNKSDNKTLNVEECQAEHNKLIKILK